MCEHSWDCNSFIDSGRVYTECIRPGCGQRLYYDDRAPELLAHLLDLLAYVMADRDLYVVDGIVAELDEYFPGWTLDKAKIDKARAEIAARRRREREEAEDEDGDDDDD